MKNNAGTSLTTIKEKYKEGKYHLLLPSVFEEQLNPFHKLSVMEVNADLSEESGDVFKVGTQKVGNTWVDYLSPAKPLLMKIALAAGIQFDPNHTGISSPSKNVYHGKALGAIKLPDGTWKTHPDAKLINLDDEEDKFKLEFMDKSIEGVTGKAGTEAAKMFKGKWTTVDKKYGKPGETEKAYIIDEADRTKFIERSVLVNMVLLRKHAPQKALTGAILRVIRALIGMKGQYTTDELKKPFVLARVNFSPDFNDPQVRREMLTQGLASMTNIFGNNPPQIAAQPIFAEAKNHTFDAANIEDDPFISESNKALTPGDAPDEEDEQPPWEQPPGEQDDEIYEDENGDSVPNPNECEVCEAPISDKVSKYSKDKFDRYLCYNHQKGAK